MKQAPTSVTSEQNAGHGHVFPRPDGVKARCGGPGLCTECSLDLARKEGRLTLVVTEDGVPCADQAEALERFKRACTRWNQHLDYAEMAHLSAWHWDQEQTAAKNHHYASAAYHKRRHGELMEALKPENNRG